MVTRTRRWTLGAALFVTLLAAGSYFVVSIADERPPLFHLQTKDGRGIRGAPIDCNAEPQVVELDLAGYHWVCTNPSPILGGGGCVYQCTGTPL